MVELMEVVLPFFKSVQVAVNWPSVVVSAWVVWHWRKAFYEFYNNHKDPARWFALGVLIAFACKAIDHSYWAYTWDLDYSGDPNAQWWFEHGAISNVLFRITGATVAGYCHIRSAKLYFGESVALLNVQIIAIHLFGAFYLFTR